MPKSKPPRKPSDKFDPIPSQPITSSDKKKVCDEFIKILKRDGIEMDTLVKWLTSIRSSYRRDVAKIDREKMRVDMVQGFKLLKGDDMTDQPESQQLSEDEATSFNISGDLARFQQLRKDKWIKDYNRIDFGNWLKDDDIIKTFAFLMQSEQETFIEETPIPEDHWIDISELYNDVMGKSLAPIGFSINLGGIAKNRKIIIDFFKGLKNKTITSVKAGVALLSNLGLITIKVGGHVMKISTEIAANTVYGIFKSYTGTLLDTLWMLFGPAFHISTDGIPDDLKERLDDKYKILMALTTMKTIFMLSYVTPGNKTIKDNIKIGFDILRGQIDGWPGRDDEPSQGEKVRYDTLLYSLNKLAEWYIMRRYIVWRSGSQALMIDNLKTIGQMNAREISELNMDSDVEMGMEPEPEPGTEDDICGICLERLELTGKLRGEELLKCCGEIYHTECLEKVTGPCPSCRAPLTRGNRSPSPPPRRTRTRTARGPSPTRHPNTLQGETRQGENHWWENMMIPLISSILYFIFARGTGGDEEP